MLYLLRLHANVVGLETGLARSFAGGVLGALPTLHCAGAVVGRPLMTHPSHSQRPRIAVRLL